MKITIDVPDESVNCMHAFNSSTMICKYCGIHNDLVKFLPKKENSELYGT